MVGSDASSLRRHNGTATKISIGLIAMALIVGGVLLAVALAMVDMTLIIADGYTGFL
jgi:hypothetical protein